MFSKKKMPVQHKAVKDPSWELTIPSGWESEGDGNLYTIYNSNGVGTLQISTYSKDTNVTEGDIDELCDDECPVGTEKINVCYSTFTGLYFFYEDRDTFWKKWLLKDGPIIVFVTYNCAIEDMNQEIAEIDNIIKTLQGRNPL